MLGDGGEFLWWSERDGFGHLYLYDGDGTLKGRVTEGPWLVEELVAVDEESRTAYFTAAGREEGRHPYFTHFYSASLDGSGARLLTPEDAVHRVVASPSGRYFVNTYSTPETPPVAVVRGRDGSVRLTVETADVSRLEEAGWIPPVPFEARGRDGVTPVYGLLWFPSSFDPTQSYPVVDYIYPGPQIGAVTRYDFSAAGRGNGRALAELGFVVFAVDAFGTPMRSKAFHDGYYGNMGDNGLPDHISALKELAGRHPQLDLGRVGIFGHSGGGFSSTDAILRYPDFFKVAVSGAGNHDNRGYHFPWGEKYQGLLEENADGTDNYDSQANQNLAANLKGKLLLHYGNPRRQRSPEHDDPRRRRADPAQQGLRHVRASQPEPRLLQRALRGAENVGLLRRAPAGQDAAEGVRSHGAVGAVGAVAAFLACAVASPADSAIHNPASGAAVIASAATPSPNAASTPSIPAPATSPPR